MGEGQGKLGPYPKDVNAEEDTSRCNGDGCRGTARDACCEAFFVVGVGRLHVCTRASAHKRFRVGSCQQ